MIWLLRHGEAEDDAPDDASRPLTAKGRRQSEAAGRALAGLDAELDACLTSPKVRARDTAAVACAALGIQPEVAEELRGGDFDAEALTAGRGEVLLVGHEPDFSRAVAMLTGARVKIKKGGLAAVDGRELALLVRPAELEAIAGARAITD